MTCRETRESGQPGEEVLDSLQALGQLRLRTGVADAHGTRFAEGAAGHAGHALGFQQRRAEIDIAADHRVAMALTEGDRDIRKDIERALWPRADHARDGA